MHLLREVEKYLRTTAVTPSRFGREVMRDPRFVHDLRQGREPGIKTVHRVCAYLARYQ